MEHFHTVPVRESEASVNPMLRDLSTLTPLIQTFNLTSPDDQKIINGRNLNQERRRSIFAYLESKNHQTPIDREERYSNSRNFRFTYNFNSSCLSEPKGQLSIASPKLYNNCTTHPKQKLSPFNFRDSVKNVHLHEILGLQNQDLGQLKYKQAYPTRRGFGNLFKVSQNHWKDKDTRSITSRAFIEESKGSDSKKEKEKKFTNKLKQSGRSQTGQHNKLKLKEQDTEKENQDCMDEKKENKESDYDKYCPKKKEKMVIKKRVTEEKQPHKINSRFIKNKNHLETNIIQSKIFHNNSKTHTKLYRNASLNTKQQTRDSKNTETEPQKPEIDDHEYFNPRSYNEISNTVKMKRIQQFPRWGLRKTQFTYRDEMKEARKQMNNYFTRYALGELKSLHKAILQYSKGDINLLKKSLVVVLNMSGILIEQEKLDKMDLNIEGNSNKFRSESSRMGMNLKKNNKMKCTMKSFRSIISTKIFPESYKQPFQENSNLSSKKMLEQYIRKINNFDCFLELYKTIEIYYFKQSIIDYLHILLGGTKYEKNKKKSNKKVMGSEVTIMLADNDSDIEEDQDLDSKQVELGYDEFYDAFRKRNSQEEALRIANFIESKIKQHFRQNLRFMYRRAQSKKKFKLGVERERDWYISLKQLFNLCYYDNDLCQFIHEIYMKQKNRTNL